MEDNVILAPSIAVTVTVPVISFPVTTSPTSIKAFDELKATTFAPEIFALTEPITVVVMLPSNTVSPLPVYVFESVVHCAVVETPSKCPASNLLCGIVK